MKKQDKEQLKLESLLDRAKDYFKESKIKEFKTKEYNVDLKKISGILYSELVNNPEEMLQLFKLVLEEMNFKNSKINLINIPENLTIKIKDLRCKHLNKLVTIKGNLVQASEVIPQVVSASFECPSCGTIISVLQGDKKFKGPSLCCCGNKYFKEISKEMIDTQEIVIGQGKSTYNKKYPHKALPEHLNVLLKEDLCEPKYKILDKIGKEIIIVGILKEVSFQQDCIVKTSYFLLEAINLKFLGEH